VELLRLRKGASKLWTSAAAPGSGEIPHSVGLSIWQPAVRLTDGGTRVTYMLLSQFGQIWIFETAQQYRNLKTKFPKRAFLTQAVLDLGI